MTEAATLSVAALAAQISETVRYALTMLQRASAPAFLRYRHLTPHQPRFWNGLNAVVRRIARSLARLAEGKLPIKRGPLKTPRRIFFGPPQAPNPLPRHYGWLGQVTDHVAALAGSLLYGLVTRPEVAELIAKDPAIMRLLVPILRSLGQWPKATRKPAVRKPRPPKPELMKCGMEKAMWRPTLEHPVYEDKRPWYWPTKKRLREERDYERAMALRAKLLAEMKQNQT